MTGPIPRCLLPALGGIALACMLARTSGQALSQEPPKLNPFGASTHQPQDAIFGYAELSDGTVLVGKIYLTRDKRLKIYDDQLQRQREVPLRAIRQIESTVKKEWMEKEWRFKEAALDEKVYTGRQYPSREYVHSITLQDGRTITGPLSEIVYVEPIADSPGARPGQAAARRLLLSKRDKGEVGQSLQSLTYVRLIKLGDEALEEGKRKAALQPPRSDSKPDTTR